MGYDGKQEICKAVNLSSANFSKSQSSQGCYNHTLKRSGAADEKLDKSCCASEMLSIFHRVNPKFCVKFIYGVNRAKLIHGGSRLVQLPPYQQYNAGGWMFRAAKPFILPLTSAHGSVTQVCIRAKYIASMGQVPVPTVPSPFLGNIHHGPIQHFQQAVIGLKHGFGFCFTSCVVLLFYTSQEAYTNFRVTSLVASYAGSKEMAFKTCLVVIMSISYYVQHFLHSPM